MPNPVIQSSVDLKLRLDQLLNFFATNIPYHAGLVGFVTDVLAVFDKYQLENITVRVGQGNNLPIDFSGIIDQAYNSEHQADRQDTLLLQFNSVNGIHYGKEFIEIANRYRPHIGSQAHILDTCILFRVMIPGETHVNKPVAVVGDSSKAIHYVAPPKSSITLINSVLQEEHIGQWSKDTAKILAAWVSNEVTIVPELHPSSENYLFKVWATSKILREIKAFFDSLDDAHVYSVIYPGNGFLVINKKEGMGHEVSHVKRTAKAPRAARKVPDTIEIIETKNGETSFTTLTKAAVAEIVIIETRFTTFWIHHKTKILTLEYDSHELMLKQYKRVIRFIKDHQPR